MNRDLREVQVFHASEIDRRDGVALWIRTLSERVNTAAGTEPVLDHVLVEHVRAHCFLGRLEFQVLTRYEPEQGALARADGTVAGESAVDLAFSFKSDAAAVATSGVRGGHGGRGVVEGWPFKTTTSHGLALDTRKKG